MSRLRGGIVANLASGFEEMQDEFRALISGSEIGWAAGSEETADHNV